MAKEAMQYVYIPELDKEGKRARLTLTTDKQQRWALLVCADGVSESGRRYLIPALRRFPQDHPQNSRRTRHAKGDRHPPRHGVHVRGRRGTESGDARVLRSRGKTV